MTTSTTTVTGEDLHALLHRLYPINRSLMGPGNRETLAILGETLPIQVSEVPTGTAVFDWAIPDEWIARGAEIIGPDGITRSDFSDRNINLAGYSTPIVADMDLEELLPHIFTLPEQPDLTPYVTRYYQRGWGFCMPETEKRALPKGRYKVRIDTTLRPGSLSYGEAVLPGSSDDEVLVATYICHPSMANDNLSGVVTAAGLYRELANLPRRHFTYRFLFVPETIGSIAWLAANQSWVKNRIKAGLVLSCVGDDGPFTFKESRRGDMIADRVLAATGAHRLAFTPVTGSDERQLCSPGFDLPVVMLSRSYPGTFPYYHTSADTPDKTPPHALAATLGWLKRICAGLEGTTRRYQRTMPFCEPMLSKHDLYHGVSIRKSASFDRSMDPRSALMWVLNMCDGTNDLTTIASRSGIDVEALTQAAERAAAAGLLRLLPTA